MAPRTRTGDGVITNKKIVNRAKLWEEGDQKVNLGEAAAGRSRKKAAGKTERKVPLKLGAIRKSTGQGREKEKPARNEIQLGETKALWCKVMRQSSGNFRDPRKNLTLIQENKDGK